MEKEQISIETDEALTEEKSADTEKSAGESIPSQNESAADGDFDSNSGDGITKKRAASKRRKKPNKTADESAQKSESLTEDAETEDNTIDAPSLDSLLYDSDDEPFEKKEETHSSFEDFLADYKAVIGKTLAMAKKGLHSEEDEAENLQEEESSDELTESDSTDDSPEAFIAEEGEDSQLTIDISLPEASDDAEIPEVKVYNPDKPRIIDTVFDFAELFIFTLAAVLVLTTFFFKHTVVEGDSMKNTLINGEHLIISDLFYTPERGDIVVFADYSENQTAPYVKRIIGLPGDTVVVDALGNVTLNGKLLEEKYVFIDGAFPADYLGKECKVPQGEVFVLGDHRNASKDSALFPYTTVKIESILGKVLFRIYPFDKFGGVD